jgi:tRNA(Ile)-lysidine synthase
MRPLLETSRADILVYAHTQGIAFRTDHTNTLSDIPRNKIRNELIPLLEQQYQPALRESLSRQMEILGAEATLIDELALGWLQRADRSPFYALHPAMQRRALILQLRKLKVLVSFDLVESLRIRECVPVMVSPGRVVHRDVHGLVKMEQVAALAFEPGEVQINLSAESGRGKLDRVKFRWALLRGAAGAAASVPDKKKGCEYFDAAKIGSIITVRHWRAGDRFQPIGMAQAVRVQDLFVNAKVPRDERRQRIMAVAADGEIAWVEGLRISERFKLDKQTSDKLKWEWQRQP